MSDKLIIDCKFQQITHSKTYDVAPWRISPFTFTTRNGRLKINAKNIFLSVVYFEFGVSYPIALQLMALALLLLIRGHGGQGVPQGSILGPFLFMIFVNGLPTPIAKANLCLFADDTSLSVSHPSSEALEQLAFVGDHGLLQWFHENRLTINLTEIKLLDFHITNRSTVYKTSSFSFILDDSLLQPPHEVKCLLYPWQSSKFSTAYWICCE